MLACSSSDPVDAGYDAGYCPPGQGMNMPQLCKDNDPCNIGNELGVGAWCSPAGNQCAKYSLTCGIDADPKEGSYFCVKLCTLNSECGTGACCTGDPLNENGGQRACVPNICPDKFCDGG
jgi:hypothetical protein